MARLDLIGNEHSGNRGHAGRPGQIGGSAPDGEGADSGGGEGHVSQKTTAPEGQAPRPAPATQSVSVPTPEAPLGTDRPTPIVAKNLEDAVSLILQGKVVEIQDVGTLFTALDKLGDIARDAKAKNEKAPHYDLCNVSVAGTNLFCGDIVKTEQFPDGIPRINMPQLTGDPRPGSDADKLPKGKGGRVDAVNVFLAQLKADGVPVADVQRVPASSLKATQMELVGPTVAKMMQDVSRDPSKEPIFISSDNYILDGHHRWAAVVGRDAEDGTLGQSGMNVIRVDAPMTELLLRAEVFVNNFGLLPQSGEGEAAPKKTALSMIFGGDLDTLPFREKLMELSARWTPDDDGSNLTPP